MYVKVKISEDQDFKHMIIKRIQEELHQILKDHFYDIVSKRVLEEIVDFKQLSSNLEYKIDKFIEKYVVERIEKILTENIGKNYFRQEVIDKYIEDYIDKKMVEKFEKMFNKRFRLNEH